MCAATRKVGSIQVSFWFSGILIGVFAGLAFYLIHTTAHSDSFIVDVSGTRGQYNEIFQGRSLNEVDLFKE